MIAAGPGLPDTLLFWDSLEQAVPAILEFLTNQEREKERLQKQRKLRKQVKGGPVP